MLGEDEVDDLEEELRNKHIERLSSGLCKPSNGVVFLDILSNLERMSDHANNLADCVLAEKKRKNKLISEFQNRLDIIRLMEYGKKFNLNGEIYNNL